MLNTLIALPALLAVTLNPAQRVGQTVEWLAHRSSLVALATPLEVQRGVDERGGTYRRTRFLLEEVIKGPESAGDTVSIWIRDTSGKRELGLDRAARESRRMLVFSSPSTATAAPMKGRYAFVGHDGSISAFSAGAPVSDLYSPRFGLVSEFDELLDRTRNQIAREDAHRHGHPDLVVTRGDVEVPSGTPAYQALFGGSFSRLFVPQYHTSAGEWIVGPEELRGRAPASYVLDPGKSKIERLYDYRRAFGNRHYVWNDVPARFRGWSYRRTNGGEPEPIELTLSVGGHVYLAVEARGMPELERDGWTLEGIDFGSTWSYTDRGKTLMVVCSKEFPSGARVQVPQVAWTGSLVLLPPRALR